MRALLAVIVCLLLGACASHRTHRVRESSRAPALPQGATHEVAEAFVGEAQPARDLDSLASWLAEDGKTWVIATASKSDQLVVFDGDSGKRLRTVGSSGSGPGQFRYPKGITAFADLLFVVERDNHRVQVLQLPDFKPLGSFGSEQLRNPYGIWLHETAPDEYEVLVTDNYLDGNKIPPLVQLGERVKRYHVHVDGGVVHADYTGAFGDTTAAGALHSVESIAGDDDNGRLAIAEELDKVGSRLRVYDLQGRYASADIGADQYHAQAKGVALYSCADGNGYWIAADRYAKQRSTFLVFDRKSLTYLGSFVGKSVATTDGIVLQPASTTQFPDGALYVINSGSTIAAFDWSGIAQALELSHECH
jgi:3-phytase